MAKRFTDTRKWEDPWYQDLDPTLKCVWGFILDHCDNAGVWVVNIKLMQFQVSRNLKWDAIKKSFGTRLREISPSKIWVPKFIDFQYGELSQTCFPHKKVFELLKSHGILEEYQKEKTRVVTRVVSRVVTTLQEEEEEEEEDLNLGFDLDLPKGDARGKQDFDEARKLFPGTKGGLTFEWSNFEKKFSLEFAQIIPKLIPAIQDEKAHKKKLSETMGAHCPPWKNFSTWINQRCWEQELGEINVKSNQSQQRTDKRSGEFAERLEL